MSITPLGGRGMIGGALGRGYRRAAAAVPWWLAGGVAAADCVAAYQAKGAASLEASYVNLAKPGTYNITPGDPAPTLTASDGWLFTANTTLALNTNVACSATRYSLIVRYKKPATNSTVYFLAVFQAVNYHAIFHLNATNKICFQDGTNRLSTVTANEGVACMCSDAVYVNGTAYSAPTAGTMPSESFKYAIGGNGAAVKPVLDINIYAAAIYSVTLTSAQAIALTTAMAAL